MTITSRLAEFALDLKLDALPAEVVETAHIRVLDTIGVALAGLGERCTRIATDVAAEAGGTGRSTLIGSGTRTSPVQAALVNGIAAHALEFDDMTFSIVSHTSATVVPAVLAVAESIGATGKQFLEAYIAGFEVTTRIGWSMHFNLLKHGWHPNGVLAVMGSAAAAARLLGADLAQTRAAIGLAASCASGLRKNVGFMAKPFHMGHAAADGVLAAQLARRGYTADPDILERGPSSKAHVGHAYFSFPEVFVGEADYDLSQIDRNLGTEYELAGDRTITRFHPGSSFPQAAIDEVIALATTHGIDPAAIDRIRLGVTPVCMVIASYGTPKTAFDARFSLKFAIAAAAIDRAVTLRQYTDQRVTQPDIQDMMARIETYVPPEFADVTDKWTDAPPTPVSCRVEIVLKDGRRFAGSRDTTNGYPGAKPDWNSVRVKYRDCAGIVMDGAQIEHSEQVLRRLSELHDIGELTAALNLGAPREAAS